MCPSRFGRVLGNGPVKVREGVNREAISAGSRTESVEDPAADPRRVVEASWKREAMEILTSSQKLERGVGHEVEKVFRGRAILLGLTTASGRRGSGSPRATYLFASQ